MLKKIMISALLIAGFSSQAAATELMVDGAWARLTPPVADNTAAYMQLTNHAGEPVKITKVTTDVARMADLHGMRMDDGRMQMYPLGAVTIKAGETMTFEPGSNHLMLMGLARPLKKDEVITITLHFGDGSSQAIKVPVRDMRLGGMMDGHHGDMKHGGMH